MKKILIRVVLSVVTVFVLAVVGLILLTNQPAAPTPGLPGARETGMKLGVRI